MTIESRRLTLAVHTAGGLIVLLLTVAVGVILWQALGATSLGDILPHTLAFAAVAVVLELIVTTWATRTVLRPLVAAEQIAARVAQGDLTAGQLIEADPVLLNSSLGRSVGDMVAALRALTSTIQGTSADAAAMAQQIAASTEQMTASTEEVASTTGDLTERANQQALIVRGAADDAIRILDISRDLATGAVEAAQRNGALARAAR